MNLFEMEPRVRWVVSEQAIGLPGLFLDSVRQ